MVFLRVPFLLPWQAKSHVTVVSQRILKPSIKTNKQTKTKTNKTKTKVSRHIYSPKLLGRGVIERVIKVNTFCRLGLFFAAGAKTNDIIEKQVHTRRFSFWL